MNHYEIIIASNKKFSYKDRLNLYKKIISEAIKKYGIVIKLQFLGLQNYLTTNKNVQNKEKVKYILVSIKINPKYIKNIEKILKNEPNVIRFIISKF